MSGVGNKSRLVTVARDLAERVHRWTLEGAKRLIPGMRLLEWGHNVGPATALRLMASEVLAMPFHHPRHEGWALAWMLYPLSWLDKLCVGRVTSSRATGKFWLLWERL